MKTIMHKPLISPSLLCSHEKPDREQKNSLKGLCYTMTLENAQDLASSNAFDLSNAVRITKNNTNLRWCQPFLCKLANVILNLKPHTETINETQHPNDLKFQTRLIVKKMQENKFQTMKN